MEIVVVTGNRKKLKEIKEILAGLPISITSLADFPSFPEPTETGKTFAENAEIKARYYAKKLNRSVLAEDSGLEVEFLKGKPGVSSARFAGPAKRDVENIAKVLKLMEGVPMEKRRAVFTSVFCLITKEGERFLFEGKKEGFITLEPKGNNGFGYDPIFLVPELKKTYAQLSFKRKNLISHRRIALEKVKKFLVLKYNPV